MSDSRTTTYYLLDRRFSKKSINFLKTPKISREENEIRRKVVPLSLMPAPPLLWLMKFYQLKRFPFNRFLDIFREGFFFHLGPASIELGNFNYTTYIFFCMENEWESYCTMSYFKSKRRKKCFKLWPLILLWLATKEYYIFAPFQYKIVQLCHAILWFVYLHTNVLFPVNANKIYSDMQNDSSAAGATTIFLFCLAWSRKFIFCYLINSDS